MNFCITAKKIGGFFVLLGAALPALPAPPVADIPVSMVLAASANGYPYRVQGDALGAYVNLTTGQKVVNILQTFSTGQDWNFSTFRSVILKTVSDGMIMRSRFLNFSRSTSTPIRCHF